MNSRSMANKKRVRKSYNETNLDDTPNASKKARKEPNNQKVIISNTHRDLCNYVDSWLNATLHQRHRLRRYSNSQVDNLDILQKDRVTSTGPLRYSPKSLPDPIGPAYDSLEGTVSNRTMKPVSDSASGQDQPCSSVDSDVSRTPSGSASSSHGQSLVQTSTYRTANLACNGIQFEHRYTPAPGHLTSLMDRVSQRRASVEPTLQHIQADYELQDVICGAPEAKVARYFAEEIVGKPGRVPHLSNQIGLSMHRRHLPSKTSTTAVPHGKISQPRPDLLYGFSERSFPNHEPQLNAMPILNANSQNLVLPFFAIEFKAQGSSGTGNLWVAENQLMAASTACVRIAQHLNNQLEQCSHTNIQHVQKINTHAFSIAMSGTEARLFVTWRDSPERYVMKHMRSYLVSEPHQFLEFRRVVRNIIDWGKDERLGEILNCFDALTEQGRS